MKGHSQRHKLPGTNIEYRDTVCYKGEEEGRARICNRCGEPKAMKDFGISGRGSYTFECKACIRKRMQADYAAERAEGSYWYWEKRVARVRITDEKKGLVCDLDADYVMSMFVKQGGKCAYTGNKCDTLSIERIDNNLGHVKGNIILVDVRLNVMRGACGQDEFLLLCASVAKHMGADIAQKYSPPVEQKKYINRKKKKCNCWCCTAEECPND